MIYRIEIEFKHYYYVTQIEPKYFWHVEDSETYPEERFNDIVQKIKEMGGVPTRGNDMDSCFTIKIYERKSRKQCIVPVTFFIDNFDEIPRTGKAYRTFQWIVDTRPVSRVEKFFRWIEKHMFEVLTFVFVLPICIWWINGFSFAWFEREPEEVALDEFEVDSLRNAKEKEEKEYEYFKYHDVDEITNEDPIRISVKELGYGNEYAALSDIVIKKWSSHSGDKNKCRKQFLETEREKGKHIKMREYLSDVTIKGDTIYFYSPCAFSGYDSFDATLRRQEYVDHRTTKLKDCRIRVVRLYNSWNEDAPTFLMEYILQDDGTFHRNEEIVKEQAKQYIVRQKEKQREYQRYLKTK